MLKFNTLRHNRTLIYLNTLQSPISFPFSLHFCTQTSSDSTSFAVSYLINNFEFSPQFASKLCNTYNVSFKTAQKPDSVLNFFRNYGFSDSQLRHMIRKDPRLLSCNPSIRVLPKFQFLLSKGASNSDIANLVSNNPLLLSKSLKNHIVPTYELIYRYLQSDKDTVARAIGNRYLLSEHLVPYNIGLLVENGVAESNITRLLRIRCQTLSTKVMLKVVEELKDLGFNPSQTAFGTALQAKILVNKTRWKDKVDAFKKWGWSDEDVLKAFRKQPHCMLISVDKINLVMSYWVDQLGWDALAIAKTPSVLGLSFEKRTIPRASVVQYLLQKGFWKKNASLTTPFVITDKMFLDRYVNRYKDESSYLLKIYGKKLDLAHDRGKTNVINTCSVSYLINNFGFSPQFASKICKTYNVSFKTAQKPDSVINFFRNHGFSDTHLRHIIPKAPCLLSCNPSKRVLPKFQFLLSKGASNSDIVNLVSKNPLLLSPCLESHIVPTYELVFRFLKSDKDTIARAIGNRYLLSEHRVPYNIRLLIENGVADSNIARLLRIRCQVLNTHSMVKVVEELKDLGFNPSQTAFCIALQAKILVNKTRWKEKVDAFKKWGWSDQDVLKAFRKQPHCMLSSVDKINLVMSYWVDQLGWDALAIAKNPTVFGVSLEKRIIPRVSVVQYLLKKGLWKKNASLTTPFVITDKMFLDKYVNRYKEESSYLLKIYGRNLDLA